MQENFAVYIYTTHMLTATCC